ncbi:MAG: response regulator, partial [Gammaproteobacteria bacterium]|nr:response regulator [Gammaproteobacteria bacterium]
MRVLLVEDDQLLGNGIQTGLRQDGYAVDWVLDGEQAWHALETDGFDLMVLDLGLPRRDGLEILNHLRRGGSDLPVLILTARDALADRVQGLDFGADDYMVKPFDLEELCARLRALIRRNRGRADPLIQVGPLSIDPVAHSVSYAGREIELSPREFT